MAGRAPNFNRGFAELSDTKSDKKNLIAKNARSGGYLF